MTAQRAEIFFPSVLIPRKCYNFRFFCRFQPVFLDCALSTDYISSMSRRRDFFRRVSLSKSAAIYCPANKHFTSPPAPKLKSPTIGLTPVAEDTLRPP